MLASKEVARGREGDDLLLVGSLLDLVGEDILFMKDEVGDAGVAVEESLDGVRILPVSLDDVDAWRGLGSCRRPSPRSKVRVLRTVDIARLQRQ